MLITTIYAEYYPNISSKKTKITKKDYIERDELIEFLRYSKKNYSSVTVVNYRNHVLYEDSRKFVKFVAEEKAKEKLERERFQAKEKLEREEKEKIQIGIFIFFAISTLFILYRFIKRKLLPFTKDKLFPLFHKYKSTKKMFRILVIISLFWVFGVLILTFISNGHGRWLFDEEMYAFIFIGLLPPALFWSYYWIKSAKD